MAKIIAAIGNKLIKVGEKIGLYPSCCCGGGCSSDIDCCFAGASVFTVINIGCPDGWSSFSQEGEFWCAFGLSYKCSDGLPAEYAQLINNGIEFFGLPEEELNGYNIPGKCCNNQCVSPYTPC